MYAFPGLLGGLVGLSLVAGFGCEVSWQINMILPPQGERPPMRRVIAWIASQTSARGHCGPHDQPRGLYRQQRFA